jgi:thiosulfate/3-mercaptopyruvate sulfurtransferase
MYTTLIQAPELQALQHRGADLALFDASFDLSNPTDASRMFESVHIAGARRADLDHDLSAHGGSVAAGTAASGGRHPLPTRETFARWLGQQGVGPSTQVVVYDRNGVNYAGRLWWMLKWCGHEAVAVLDGGLQHWQAQGGAVASGPADAPTPAEGPYPLAAPLAELATFQQVRAAVDAPGRMTVVDARGGPRYRGEVEPLDPVAGHIPGALNRPFNENIGPDGRFKPAEQLRQEFETVLGASDPATVVHHCGSGVSAVPNILAMELAGWGRRPLYAGSWSEWCNTPGAPVAKG